MHEIISEIAGLRMELQEIEKSFQKRRRDLLVLSNEKLPMEERTREIELTIAYEVSIESDESGKKTYSNDTLRNAEARKRLKGNIEYETLKGQLDFLDKQERTIKTEIDILDRKFRIIEQMVALVMVEGHILTHYKDMIDYERNN